MSNWGLSAQLWGETAKNADKPGGVFAAPHDNELVWQKQGRMGAPAAAGVSAAACEETQHST